MYPLLKINDALPFEPESLESRLNRKPKHMFHSQFRSTACLGHINYAIYLLKYFETDLNNSSIVNTIMRESFQILKNMNKYMFIYITVLIFSSNLGPYQVMLQPSFQFHHILLVVLLLFFLTMKVFILKFYFNRHMPMLFLTISIELPNTHVLPTFR